MLRKLISLFQWSSKQCFVSSLLMGACCLLLIELSKQSMHIFFNYFNSFSSYDNHLRGDNDCYHLFVPSNSLLVILHKQLVACVTENWLLANIPLGTSNWLPKAKYLFLFRDWMVYFVTKTILINKFIASSCNIVSRSAIWRYTRMMGTCILNIISVMRKRILINTVIPKWI